MLLRGFTVTLPGSCVRPPGALIAEASHIDYSLRLLVALSLVKVGLGVEISAFTSTSIRKAPSGKVFAAKGMRTKTRALSEEKNHSDTRFPLVPVLNSNLIPLTRGI